MQSDDTFQQGVKDCLPTVFGYLSISIATGVIAKTAGFSIIEIAFMSTLIYAGSAQFILAGMYDRCSCFRNYFTVFLLTCATFL